MNVPQIFPLNSSFYSSLWVKYVSIKCSLYRRYFSSYIQNSKYILRVPRLEIRYQQIKLSGKTTIGFDIIHDLHKENTNAENLKSTNKGNKTQEHTSNFC